MVCSMMGTGPRIYPSRNPAQHVLLNEPVDTTVATRQWSASIGTVPLLASDARVVSWMTVTRRRSTMPARARSRDTGVHLPGPRRVAGGSRVFTDAYNRFLHHSGRHGRTRHQRVPCAGSSTGSPCAQAWRPDRERPRSGPLTTHENLTRSHRRRRTEASSVRFPPQPLPEEAL